MRPRVAAGEQDREERHRAQHDERDPQERQHDVVRDQPAATSPATASVTTARPATRPPGPGNPARLPPQPPPLRGPAPHPHSSPSGPAAHWPNVPSAPNRSSPMPAASYSRARCPPGPGPARAPVAQAAGVRCGTGLYGGRLLDHDDLARSQVADRQPAYRPDATTAGAPPAHWPRAPISATRGAATVADVHGRCDERFEAVRSALAANLDSGDELGASLVLDIDGDIVIDMWGGFCDEARTIGWSAGHHHQRLVVDQDGDQPGGADAGRSWRAGR